jgi:hypothetical protein
LVKVCARASPSPSPFGTMGSVRSTGAPIADVEASPLRVRAAGPHAWRGWVVGGVVLAVLAMGAGAAAGSIGAPLVDEGPGYGGDADQLHVRRSGDGLVVVAYGFLAGSLVEVTADSFRVVTTADAVGSIAVVVEAVSGSVVVEAFGTSPDLEPITLRATTW